MYFVTTIYKEKNKVIRNITVKATNDECKKYLGKFFHSFDKPDDEKRKKIITLLVKKINEGVSSYSYEDKDLLFGYDIVEGKEWEARKADRIKEVNEKIELIKNKIDSIRKKMNGFTMGQE